MEAPQHQFLKPAQHVPFYVKRPLVFDSSSNPQIYDYEYRHNIKPSSFSVDLTHRLNKSRHSDKFSEPYNKAQSKSLRDIFEKAVLRGDVPITPATDENINNTVIRNPSFITSSLPRQHKPYNIQLLDVIGRDNYIYVDGFRGSRDYFIDSSDSDSETISGGVTGKPNEAFADDASSTLSDELFKSTSDGQDERYNDEGFTHIQPLPQLLDIMDHQQSRSTLGGFFKPKYRDYPRDNVHRTSEKEHKQVIDYGKVRGVKPIHTPDMTSNLSNKLPRTKYPSDEQGQIRSSEPSVEEDKISRRSAHSKDSSPEMSHDRYLPKSHRSSRTRSPRLSSHNETVFNEFDVISSASPEPIRIIDRSRQGEAPGQYDSAGRPLEQMQVDEAPWVKAEQRRQRRRQRQRLYIIIGVVASLSIIIAISLGGYFASVSRKDETITVSVTPLSTVSTSPTTQIIKSVEEIHLTFDGSMRITNELYTQDLDNRSSPKAYNLSKRFCDAMEKTFDSTDYGGNWRNCTVTKLSSGSVVIDFSLNFGGRSVNDSFNGTSTIGNSSNVNVGSILAILTQTIEEKRFGAFVVDTSSLTIKQRFPPDSSQKNDSLTTGSTTPRPGTTTTISVIMTSTAKVSTSLKSATTVTSTTVISSSTVPTTGCAAKNLKDNGKYVDENNCTNYKTCLPESGDVEILPCQPGQMFRPNGNHSGLCRPCDPKVCSRCQVIDNDDD